MKTCISASGFRGQGRRDAAFYHRPLKASLPLGSLSVSLRAPLPYGINLSLARGLWATWLALGDSTEFSSSLSMPLALPEQTCISQFNFFQGQLCCVFIGAEIKCSSQDNPGIPAPLFPPGGWGEWRWGIGSKPAFTAQKPHHHSPSLTSLCFLSYEGKTWLRLESPQKLHREVPLLSVIDGTRFLNGT